LGQIEPKDTCPATKYCVLNVQYDCTKGNFCPAGYDYQIKCQPGTYQNQTAQATCIDCPEGYYCDGDLSGNSYTPLKCPPGYYCPAKTIHYHLYPCPAGRLGLATATAYGLKVVGECTSCTATKYCDRRGLSAVTGPCKNGYLCSAGSIHPTGLNTQECPQGSYCVAGVETACAAGTYNAEKAATSSTDCIPCEHGKYCPNTISSKVDCPSGKTCAEGLSAVSGAVDCLKGHYCPTGSFQGIQCAPGTYQDTVGQTSCKSCTEGNICNGLALEAQTTCPAYRTCPASSIRGRRCEPGMYIPTSSNTCTSCLAGKYCWPTPKAAPDNGEQGTCGAGYICQGGSLYEKPLISLSSIVAGSSEFSTYNGPAFPGYSSTDGQTNTACAAGTFQPSPFSTACIACREGHYCPNTGMSSLDNFQCSAGYACGASRTTASPAADICPVNTYCLSGSVFAQRCADGYKNPSSTGQEACSECGTGSFCYQSGTPGSYTEHITACPTSNTECSSEILKRELNCQDGYYLTGGVCTLCPATKYCRGGYIAGDCVAGYICNQDPSSPISTPAPINRACPINEYCLIASTAGTTCGAGTFNGNLGAISNQE